MASLPINAGSASALPVSGQAVSTEERALNHAVAAAVRQLNEGGVAGAGREVTFTIDPVSRRPVVKVIETSTQEVVHQWPSEHVLALAENYNNKVRDSR